MDLETTKPKRWERSEPAKEFGVGRYGRKPSEDLATVLTAEKRMMICALVTKGLSIANASKYCEVSPDTVAKAIQRGRADLIAAEEDGSELSVPGQFVRKLEKAQAAYALKLTVKYEKAMDKDPRAAMAFLELMARLQPNDYGRRQVLKVEQDTTLRIAFVEKDGEEWQRGHSRATVQAQEQKLIEGATSVGNEIINAEMRELTQDSDDNDF